MSDYHVVHDNQAGVWKVKRAGSDRSSSLADTQSDAIKIANDLARNSGGGEVNIHRKDNAQIRDKNTVGKPDPYPPKG